MGQPKEFKMPKGKILMGKKTPKPGIPKPKPGKPKPGIPKPKPVQPRKG